MRIMTTRRFIARTAIKLVALIVISTIVAGLINSITPLINNDLAMGQMENSDALFVAYNTYNKLVPIVWVVYGILTAYIIGRIGYDTYKFIKTKIETKKETKENEKN